MKNLKLLTIFNLNQTIIFVTLIFLAGLLLRLWAIPERFVFGGDESYLIWEIWNLTNGHLSLVGFEVGGVGGIKLLPYLLYVLSGPFLIFSGHPLFVEVTLGLFGAVRGVLFYLIGKTVFNERIGLLAAGIYLASVRLNLIDRKFFGAAFLILSSLAVFYFLAKILKEKQIKVLDLAILGSIIGISFSAHYQSVFLFLGSIFFIIFIKKSKNLLKNLGILTLSTSVWFVPLILFELRHNFSITQRFLALTGETTQDWPFFSFLGSAQYLAQLFYGIIASIVYKIPLVDILQPFVFWLVFLSIFALIFFLINSKKDFQFRPFLIYFLFLITLGFFVLSFLQRPHYDIDPYYWFLIPIFVFSQALFLNWFLGKPAIRIFAILALAIFGIFNFKNLFTQNLSDTYSTKKQVVEKILDDAEAKHLNQMIVKFDSGEPPAFDYLFYYQVKKGKIDASKITLISRQELFQERVLLGGRLGPIKILNKTQGSQLEPDYIVAQANTNFPQFLKISEFPPYSIHQKAPI